MSSLVNYEKLLRGVEADFKSAKQNEVETVIDNYEKKEDDYNQLPLTKHQLEDDYYETVASRVKDNDDEIELDEAELKAYLNLKKANKILEQREQPNTMATALLRSNEKVNKTDKISQKIQDIQLSQHLPWLHTLTLHSFKPLVVSDFENDLERELAFYNQALLSANEGVTRLTKQNIPCIRPDDYFAEMLKSDEHMMKIRDRLLYSKKVIEAREARRKQREQKKLGKKIQVAKLQEKLEEKKANLEAIKLWKKKSAGKEFDIDDLEKNVDEVKQNHAAAKAGIKRPQQQQQQQRGKAGANGKGKGKGGKGGPKGVQKPAKRMGKNRRAQERSKKK